MTPKSVDLLLKLYQLCLACNHQATFQRPSKCHVTLLVRWITAFWAVQILSFAPLMHWLFSLMLTVIWFRVKDHALSDSRCSSNLPLISFDFLYYSYISLPHLLDLFLTESIALRSHCVWIGFSKTAPILVMRQSVAVSSRQGYFLFL